MTQQKDVWQEFPPPTDLTLRDWFAGQFLAGMVRDITDAHRRQKSPTRRQKVAYDLADAMLGARSMTTEERHTRQQYARSRRLRRGQGSYYKPARDEFPGK